jgi:hypothetical protein
MMGLMRRVFRLRRKRSEFPRLSMMLGMSAYGVGIDMLVLLWKRRETQSLHIHPNNMSSLMERLLYMFLYWETQLLVSLRWNV